MTLYEVVLAVHVAAVVVAFGVTFAYPFLFALAGRADGPQRAALHRLQEQIGRRLITPGLLVVLLAGAYLASDRDLWSEPWVAIPFAIVIVIGGLAGAVLNPGEARLAGLAESGDDAGYAALRPRVRAASYAVSALVLVAVFVMVTKPG